MRDSSWFGKRDGFSGHEPSDFRKPYPEDPQSGYPVMATIILAMVDVMRHQPPPVIIGIGM